jgi:hypothetical protein
VINRQGAGHGKVAVKDPGQAADGFAIGRAVAVHPRAVEIGHAARPNRDAAFAGALAVTVGIVEVVKEFVALPADLVPHRLRQGGGDDLGGVERQPVALVALEGGGEAFGGAQDHRGFHRAARGGDKAGGVFGDGGILDDAHPETRDRAGKALHQFGGLDAGHARRHEATEGAGDAQAGIGFRRAKGMDAVAVAPEPVMGELALQIGQMGGMGGDGQLVGAADVSLDPLGFADADHLIDGAFKAGRHVQNGLPGGLRRVMLVAP